MGLEDVRASVAASLRSREAQDVETIFGRLRREVPDHLGDENSEYMGGLRKAVAATFDYCLSAMECGGDSAEALPTTILEQARRAARNKVPLGTVMRRCNEGERLLREIVAEETRERSTEMHTSLLRAPESAFRRLTAAIQTAYEREIERMDGSVERKREETVRRLLAGERVEDHDLATLGYTIHSCSHLGIVATGPGAEAALSHLKAQLAYRALVVSAGAEEVLGWVAAQGMVVYDLKRMLLHGGNLGVSAGVGGPHPEVDGLRRAYQEAKEALRLAQRTPNAVAYYADDALLAGVLRNEPLRRWLKDLILPISDTHCRILRAYIDAGCNASSAASAVSMDRHTVTRSVKDTEERIQRRVEACLAELDISLRLAKFEQAAADTAPSA